MKSCDVSICKAECCGMAPIPTYIFERNKSRLQREVEIIPVPASEGIEHVAAVDENMNCGFLTKDHRCAIYEDRPDICRRFGMPNETHFFLRCSHLDLSLDQINFDMLETLKNRRRIPR